MTQHNDSYSPSTCFIIQQLKKMELFIMQGVAFLIAPLTPPHSVSPFSLSPLLFFHPQTSGAIDLFANSLSG